MTKTLRRTAVPNPSTFALALLQFLLLLWFHLGEAAEKEFFVFLLLPRRSNQMNLSALRSLVLIEPSHTEKSID